MSSTRAQVQLRLVWFGLAESSVKREAETSQFERVLVLVCSKKDEKEKESEKERERERDGN